jgi:phosphoribosylformylglycinamidine synthase
MTRKAKALVLRTAGTNCDRETCIALERAGATVALEHVQRLIETPSLFEDCALLVVPGGFSYGDDVAAGRILGYELRQHLAAPVREFVDSGGFVLGVCNGFQVLVDTGLLQPAGEQRSFALSGNSGGRFECRWVHLRVEDSACAWLEPGTITPMPVAHAEGRFLVRSEHALEELERRRQIVLTYVDPARPAAESCSYPHNPNGSLKDVAGICDPTGRVLGLMPHPERNITPWNHPHWTRLPERAQGEGLEFYRRMVQAAASTSGRGTTVTTNP